MYDESDSVTAPTVGEAPRRGRNRTPSAQRIGAKGASTRRQLIEATAKLVEECGMHRLRIADVAREAGVSQATFYVYFKDLEEAALAVLEDLSQSTPRLLRAADRRGSKDQAVEHARAMTVFCIVGCFSREISRLTVVTNDSCRPGCIQYLLSRISSPNALLKCRAQVEFPSGCMRTRWRGC